MEAGVDIVSELKSADKPPIRLIFTLISALVTPPIMWLVLLLHTKPEDWGHIILETFKRPLTYAWFAYAGFVLWLASGGLSQ